MSQIRDGGAREDADERGLPYSIGTQNAHYLPLLRGCEAIHPECIETEPMNRPLFHLFGQSYNLDRLERALVNAYATSDAELLRNDGLSAIGIHDDGFGARPDWRTVFYAFEVAPLWLATVS